MFRSKALLVASVALVAFAQIAVAENEREHARSNTKICTEQLADAQHTIKQLRSKLQVRVGGGVVVMVVAVVVVGGCVCEGGCGCVCVWVWIRVCVGTGGTLGLGGHTAGRAGEGTRGRTTGSIDLLGRLESTGTTGSSTSARPASKSKDQDQRDM